MLRRRSETGCMLPGGVGLDGRGLRLALGGARASRALRAGGFVAGAVSGSISRHAFGWRSIGHRGAVAKASAYRWSAAPRSACRGGSRRLRAPWGG
eukprot:8473169-Alexandrium_andersonii.AAC.1